MEKQKDEEEGSLTECTLTMAQAKEADRIAIEEMGIDSLWLMENAAKKVTDYISEEIRTISCDDRIKIIVVCGAGNNGGDGFAIARILKESKETPDVEIIFCGNYAKMTTDCRVNYERALACGILIKEAGKCSEDDYKGDVIVDALFGVGLKRPLEGIYLETVQRMNGSDATILACDVPSGVHGDTGEILGGAVCARATITFSRSKPGFFGGEGPALCGKIVVAQIGIPEEAIREAMKRIPCGLI